MDASMREGFKPMLAFDVQLGKVQYPAVALPKVDGVRGVNHLGKAHARSMKPIRNKFTQDWFSKPEFDGFDGEMAAEAPNHPRLCSLTTSATSEIKGEPQIQWWIFDDFREPWKPFIERIQSAHARVRELQAKHNWWQIAAMPYRVVKDEAELLAYMNELLDDGYEGIIVRGMDKPYKYGRSTQREFGLGRIKPCVEELFKITAVEEAMENTNEAQVNELGRTFRSSSQEGMVPKGMIGKVHGAWERDVEWNGQVLFKKGDAVLMGPGTLSHDERKFYWENQQLFIGRLGKCKTFPIGVKDKPRQPRFSVLVDENNIS